MEDPFAQIGRKLDEVVGERFDAAGGKDPVGRMRATLAKWIVAGACAVGAVCVIVWVIESHRLPPENARPLARKPVIIQILPAPAKP